jgi:hypothetical protein
MASQVPTCVRGEPSAYGNAEQALRGARIPPKQQAGPARAGWVLTSLFVNLASSRSAVAEAKCQKLKYISDSKNSPINSPMSTLPRSILLHAESLPEGGLMSPKEFLHLASRAAVDQAFSRLTKDGKLLRVGRGIYVKPVSSRFGTRAPAPQKVVQSIAVQSGELVVPHGANAANSLGLTQQVPIREVYLTSGRSRKLKLGRSEVTVRHAPGWMLALGSGEAGAAVRALAWMGPTHVRKSLATLRRTLPSAQWQALLAGRAGLPSWMARAIGEAAARG